ncbi:MAG: isopropylmalate/homocitrate/citramalate synthase [Myxococcota bacterium]|jgi:isopropylmalate/homocitrate/citramalate synthase
MVTTRMVTTRMVTTRMVTTKRSHPLNPIFPWNEPIPTRGAAPLLVDETLRDGIQSPSVRNPNALEKAQLLRLMARSGVSTANIGLPGAGGQAVADAVRLARAISVEKLPIAPQCAARTHIADLDAVAEVAARSGVEIETCAFVGASGVRRLVEGWSLDHIRGLVERTGRRLAYHGLPFTFVTEDTIRTDPETLDVLFRTAIDCGATRLVICDTAGYATRSGLHRLYAFVRGLIQETGCAVELDWHGHDDRGLSLALAIEAAQLGFDRVHGTILGIGERVGNTPMDLLILNLYLDGALKTWPEGLREYVYSVSELMEAPIARDYPAFGADAFRTATGVHAAAIEKALAAGEPELADRVYSAVPARELGLKHNIEVGYYSGRANAVGWLRYRNLEVSPARIDVIMALAKTCCRTLTAPAITHALRDAGLLGTKDKPVAANNG